ncbi:septal ring lytic transglycosylase RlpA family protein [Comamonas sp. JC664]|nr:septal ring lytic transglycosylase RlpA family protein [Comamonas sp. JC664]
MPRSYLGEGLASFYGPGLHGRPTASGERFNQEAMTAAHRKLRFGSCLRVVNMENGRAVKVRVNDRGPFVDGRVVDLSKGAARKLDMLDKGVVRVRLYRCDDRLSEIPQAMWAAPV